MIFEMPYAQQAYGISLKCRMLVSAMPSAWLPADIRLSLSLPAGGPLLHDGDNRVLMLSSHANELDDV